MTWSAHLSMLFRELPYLERPSAAAKAGFTAVETWWPDEKVGPQWSDAIARNRLTVSLINAYGGEIDAGDRGFLNVAERHDEALQVCRDAVELARRCGASRINVLVGRELPDRTREAQLDQVAATLAECTAIAREAGLTLVVEPINELDVPGYLVPTAAAAVDLIESVGSPNLRLLYDAYHAARSGEDPCREVASLATLIDHAAFRRPRRPLQTDLRIHDRRDGMDFHFCILTDLSTDLSTSRQRNCASRHHGRPEYI